MKLSKDYLGELYTLACEAAVLAGKLITRYIDADIRPQVKQSGNTPASQVVTEVDFRSEALIIKTLSPSLDKFDLALLSEEKPDDLQRLVKDYFWCIDPLDGTLAFTESVPGYAVSIALVAKDGTPMIGAIYDPVTQTLYSALHKQGAYRNGHAWTIDKTEKNTYVSFPCDRSLVARADFQEIEQSVTAITKRHEYLGVTLTHHQGAVMNAITALIQAPGLYFKPDKPEAGGGSLWDFAASACLYKELGMIACNYYGERLDLNRPDSSFMNHQGVIFATDQELASAVVALDLNVA
jgi:fructose-1,6-bisphosphatase/inositol monophosphatase family enzyme